jgi:hypothetical protein
MKICVTEDWLKFANCRGKVSVNILLITITIYVGFLCLFVSFVSGPAHTLCLTVASGWKKERCMPEIEVTVTVTVEPFASVKLFCLLLSLFC